MQQEMRQAIVQQATINEHRIQELNEIQQGVREQIISVNEFIRECEGKENDAGKKV
jgi:hypothetical protein